MTAQLDASQLRVTRGSVTAEELAAIVVVINAAVAAGTARRRRAVAAEWNAAHRSMRRPLLHGVGAWRRSALPH